MSEPLDLEPIKARRGDPAGFPFDAPSWCPFCGEGYPAGHDGAVRAAQALRDFHALIAEAERLREALAEVVRLDDECKTESDDHVAFYAAADVSRAALGLVPRDQAPV